MSLLAAWLTTLAVAVVSAVIPVINIEIYLLGVAAVAPASMAVPLVLAVAAGAARMSLQAFVVFGFLGRAVRFSVIVALPQLARDLL